MTAHVVNITDALFQSPPGTPTVLDGLVDNTGVYQAFHDWGAALPATDTIDVTIPAGSISIMGVVGVGTFTRWLRDILCDITINATGAIFSARNNLAQDCYSWNDMGAGGVQNDAAHGAYIHTAAAGATSVFLTTLADASKFSNSQYVMISGFDIQGGGYPPACAFFEFIRINSVALAATTGEITLQTPLQYGYKETWPSYPLNDITNMGQPALWVPPVGHDRTQVWNGGTMNLLDQQGFGVRHSTINNVTWVDLDGGSRSTILASFQGTLICNNCAFGSTQTAEMDKLCDTWIIDNCTIHRIEVQTSCVNNLIIRNGTSFTTGTDNYLNGTPRTTTISDSYIPKLTLGCFRSGGSGAVTITNSQIDYILDSPTGSGNIPSESNYSLSNGVISYLNYANVTGCVDNGSGFIRLTLDCNTAELQPSPMGVIQNVTGTTNANGSNVAFTIFSASQIDLTASTFNAAWTGGGDIINAKTVNWPQPGRYAMFRGSFNPLYQSPIFYMSDVTQTASHTYVQTNLPTSYTSFADIPHLFSSTYVSIQNHPCPSLTVSGLTGAAGSYLNGHPAGRPWGEYYKRTFTGGPIIDYEPVVGTRTIPWVFGSLVRVTVTVNDLYSGAGTPVFYFFFPQLIYPNGTTAVWDAQFDPTQGLGVPRIITPTTVSGIQAGDNSGAHTPPGADVFWPFVTLRPNFNADTSSDPSASITVIFESLQDLEGEEAVTGIGIQSQGNKYGVYRSRPIKIPHV